MPFLREKIPLKIRSSARTFLIEGILEYNLKNIENNYSEEFPQYLNKRREKNIFNILSQNVKSWEIDTFNFTKVLQGKDFNYE